MVIGPKNYNVQFQKKGIMAIEDNSLLRVVTEVSEDNILLIIQSIVLNYSFTKLYSHEVRSIQ